MNANRPPSSRRFQPAVLDLDDRIHPPILVWEGTDEETFRRVSTEDILFLLGFKVMGPSSHSAAVAELKRRGVTPPDA